METHNPIEVYKILHKISTDPFLKFTSHNWDDPNLYNKPIDDFINKLDSYYNDIYKITSYNSRVWWDVIYPFIFQKNAKENSYGWGECKIKQGWQYPSSLIDWCRVNLSKKQSPMIYPIKKELINECAENKYIKIFGKKIQYFVHLTDLFKREIEFRDDSKDFYYDVMEIIRKELPDIKIQNEKDLKKINSYAYTKEVLNGIKSICKMIKFHPVNNQLEIKAYIVNNNKVVEFTNVNGFYSKNFIELMEPKDYLEDVIKNLFSNAHFEIETSFIDGNYCIKYLYNEGNIERINNVIKLKPLRESLNTKPNGFTFRILFPIF